MRHAVADTEALPPGVVQKTPYGSHYVVHTVYGHDHHHGRIPLRRFSSEDLGRLMALMRSKARAADRDRVVFLDTETTGVQGGTGMCPFLAGAGYFQADDFHTVQFFNRNFDEEPSMLHALAELLSRFQLVITYNGDAFDIPLLESRLTMARQENVFSGLMSFDLLFTARKLWKNGHGSCRLTALERELLSFFRVQDVPGAMIPRAYFDYLRHEASPALRGVFTHNLHDVISLAALAIRACDRMFSEPAQLDDPLDLYSVARVFENSTEWKRAIRLYEMAIAGGLREPIRRQAFENLSVVCRRSGDHERSYRICKELMEDPEFSLIAYEGAAIFLERVAANPEAALAVVEEGLRRLHPMNEKKRWIDLLQARRERLQQRVIRGIL